MIALQIALAGQQNSSAVGPNSLIKKKFFKGIVREKAFTGV